MVTMEQRMYSVTEVAEMLKITTLTVRRKIKDKKIRAVKMGKEWRIDERELERIRKDGV